MLRSMSTCDRLLFLPLACLPCAAPVLPCQCCRFAVLAELPVSHFLPVQLQVVWVVPVLALVLVVFLAPV